MLDLHIVEILVWSFALNRTGLIVHSYDAIYFCANCYTTLGMGKVDVEEHWRILSPIIGISGLFTFAWTTSALVDIVASNRRLLNRLEDKREQEMHMRFALRKEEWDALKTEKSSELADTEKLKTAAAGFSFLQRLRIWWKERKRIEELCSAKMAQLEDLKRQERLKESEVDAKPPTQPLTKG
jgi:hypothetical protein